MPPSSSTNRTHWLPLEGTRAALPAGEDRDAGTPQCVDPRLLRQAVACRGGAS
jgi:hypothetical protein